MDSGADMFHADDHSLMAYTHAGVNVVVAGVEQLLKTIILCSSQY